MSEETTAIAAPEAPTSSEAPSDPTVNLDAPEAPEEHTGDGGVVGEVTDVDEVEIDIDNEKYRVPKKLKDAFLMQSDYTKKTQEVASIRKALEADRASIKQQAEASQAHMRDIAKVVNADERIAQYDKINWGKLQQEDPLRASELWMQRGQWMEHRGKLVSEIQQREYQRTQEATQAFEKRYRETNETLAKEIPGWNAQLANELREFALADGYTADELRELAINVKHVKNLHRAYVGTKLVNAKTQAAQAAEPKVEAKPLTKVSGAGARSGVTPETAKDMESYVAARRKQGFGKR